MAGRSLFDALEIGSLHASNRLMRAATYERASDARGSVTPEIGRIYRELAEGGVGTIIMSFAYVREDAYRRDRMLGLDRDEVLRLKQITGLAEAFKNEEFSKSWI